IGRTLHGKEVTARMPNGRAKLVLQVAGSALSLVRVRYAPTRAARQAAAPVHVELLAQACSPNTKPDGLAITDGTVKSALANAVREHRLAGRDVIVLLHGASVSCHHMTLPALDADSTRKAVHLKLANLLHYSADEALTTVERLEHDRPHAGDSQHVYRVACIPASTARAVCDAVFDIGLVPADVLPAPAAIESLAASSAAVAECPHAAVLHIGESGATMVLLQYGTVTMSHELPCATRELTAALMRPIIAQDQPLELNETQARELRDAVGIPEPGQTVESLDLPAERVLPLLEPVLQQWARVITQWLSFAATSEGAGPVEQLVLIGPGASIPGLAAAFDSRLPARVSAKDLFCDSVWIECSLGLTSDGARPHEFGAVLGAARKEFRLPSLLPDDVRRGRRLRAAGRMARFGSPVLTAGLLIAAFLLNRLGASLSPVLAAEEAAMAQVQARAAELRGIERLALEVARMKQDANAFIAAGPRWTGVFKEIARILPAPLTLRQLEGRRDELGMELLVAARLDPSAATGDFDDLIQKTLIAFQESIFFDGVAIVSASRIDDESGNERDQAELELQMRLIYPGADGRAIPASGAMPRLTGAFEPDAAVAEVTPR
ncbi:MAG: hypothetical protein V3T70_00445, partial [Phycisphaerae bacterium]